MSTSQYKVYKMTTQGARIRDARVNLGLTQAEFAKRCGVHRQSQLNYELDKRHPSEAYLDALEELGIDSIYVMTGAYRSDHYLYPELYNYLMFAVLNELGYSEEEAGLCLQLFEIKLKKITPTDESSDETRAWTKEVASILFRDSGKISDLVNHAAELDSTLLGEVLAAVDSELLKRPGTLSSEKKGRLVASTYRNAKVQGKIDLKLLAEAVSLAV